MKYITKILALFGVGVVCTACYGVLHREYRPLENFTGRVSDENGVPIRGIRVTPITHSSHTDNSYTDVDGRYRINELDMDILNSIVLEFDDVDGDENGGDFASAAVSVGRGIGEVPTVVMHLKSNE